MTLELIFFLLLSLTAIATALGMLLSRNAIYSALFLVLNFTTVAVFYLLLGAPFIAMAQVTVYAGAIMVLFLFVIMLLGGERLSTSPTLRFHPMIAIPAGLALLAVFVINIMQWAGQIIDIADTPADYGAPKAVGQLLFSQYMLPFEVTAVILLAAVIGAIILAKSERPTIGQAARRALAASQKEEEKQ
jgi:NADH-quinone oxidoreductase subunit J